MIALPNWRCKIGRHRPVTRGIGDWAWCGLCGRFMGKSTDLGWKGPKHRAWHDWPLIRSVRAWWQGKRAWKP